MAGNKAKDASPPQRTTKMIRTRESSPNEPVCYWTTNRPPDGPRKQASEFTVETAACHDCQRAHVPQRCQSNEGDACGLSMCCTCSHKWRARYAAAPEVTAEQLAKFDEGWCPRCLGICACKRCICKPCNIVGGGAPVFDEQQQREFATHMLAVLKPHMDAYLTARDEEVAAGNEGRPVGIKSMRKVKLVDRMLCDVCAACITDVHRTCSQCEDYDACIKCCQDMRKQNQDVVCGKCEGAMHLVRRFDAAIEKSLASIGQVLEQCRVDAGRSHLWDFHATSENQRATADAGPPDLPYKKQKKNGKSPAGEEDADQEEAAANAANRPDIWWEYGKGPEYLDDSSQQESGPEDPICLRQARQGLLGPSNLGPSNLGQQANRADPPPVTAASKAVEQAGRARVRPRRTTKPMGEMPLAALDSTAVRQEMPESRPASSRPAALSQPQQEHLHDEGMAAQAQVPQLDLGQHGMAIQQQAEQPDLGQDGMAVQQQDEQPDFCQVGMAAQQQADQPADLAVVPMDAEDPSAQDVEMQEPPEAGEGNAGAQDAAAVQPAALRNAGSSSSGNSADSNVQLPNQPAMVTRAVTIGEFERNVISLMSPLCAMLRSMEQAPVDRDAPVPSGQVTQLRRNAKEARTGFTELCRNLKSTKQHYRAQQAAAVAAAAVQDAPAVEQGPDGQGQGPDGQGQAQREPLPLYRAPAPQLEEPPAAAAPASPQVAPLPAQPTAAAAADTAPKEQADTQAGPGREADAEADAAQPVESAGPEDGRPEPEADAPADAAQAVRPAGQKAAADRAEPKAAEAAPTQTQGEGGSAEVRGAAAAATGEAQKQRKRPGRPKKQGRAVIAAQGAPQGTGEDAAGTSADGSIVAPHEQGPDWSAVAAADKRVTAVRQGGPDAAASNYLWTPNAADCAMDSQKRIEYTRVFQQQFCQIGKPVVVRAIQPGFLWDPDTLQRATLDLTGIYGIRTNKSAPKRAVKAPTPLTVVDQRNMNDYAMKQTEFFKAFRAGGDQLKGIEEPLMLKVKDYPPEAAFAKEMPRHWQDFMQCLPFQEYCHPDGPLNIARYLTSALIKPDLGPKSYIATGRLEEHAEGDSVTKLHVDLSDAINVLMYMEGRSTSVRCGDTPADPKADPTYGGAGAVWDIFQRQDVPQLQAFLYRHCADFRHGGKPVKFSSIKHAIHSQKFYLNSKHLQLLKEECGVEPWHFEQHPGEGVFIPAGCPHQVRNLASCVKVAVDFVLPESLDQAFKFAEEFRVMAKDEAWEHHPDGDPVYVHPSDRTHTDKLQAELSMCLAAKHAADLLSGTAPSAEAEQAKPPKPRKSAQQPAGKKSQAAKAAAEAAATEAAPAAAAEPKAPARATHPMPTGKEKMRSYAELAADKATAPVQKKKKKGKAASKAAMQDDSEPEDWQPTSSAAAAAAARQAERKSRASGKKAVAQADSEERKPSKGAAAAEARQEDAARSKAAGKGGKQVAKADMTSDDDSFSKPAVKGKKRRSLDRFEQSEEDVAAAKPDAREGKRAKR